MSGKRMKTSGRKDEVQKVGWLLGRKERRKQKRLWGLLMEGDTVENEMVPTFSGGLLVHSRLGIPEDSPKQVY